MVRTTGRYDTIYIDETAEIEDSGKCFVLIIAVRKILPNRCLEWHHWKGMVYDEKHNLMQNMDSR